MIAHYWDLFIGHYGWQGFALAVAIIALLGVQIYYYGIAYARIAKYRNDRRPRRIENNTPEISVIVTLYNENYSYLESGLLHLLSQEYSAYEVVVVYIGGDNDFYEDLSRMKLYYPNLRTTKIEAKAASPYHRRWQSMSASRQRRMNISSSPLPMPSLVPRAG